MCNNICWPFLVVFGAWIRVYLGITGPSGVLCPSHFTHLLPKLIFVGMTLSTCYCPKGNLSQFWVLKFCFNSLAPLNNSSYLAKTRRLIFFFFFRKDLTRMEKGNSHPNHSGFQWSVCCNNADWRRYSAFTESLLVQNSGKVAILNVWQKPHSWLDCFSRALGWILIGSERKKENWITLWCPQNALQGQNTWHMGNLDGFIISIFMSFMSCDHVYSLYIGL